MNDKIVEEIRQLHFMRVWPVVKYIFGCKGFKSLRIRLRIIHNMRLCWRFKQTPGYYGVRPASWVKPPCHVDSWEHFWVAYRLRGDLERVERKRPRDKSKTGRKRNDDGRRQSTTTD